MYREETVPLLCYLLVPIWTRIAFIDGLGTSNVESACEAASPTLSGASSGLEIRSNTQSPEPSPTRSANLQLHHHSTHTGVFKTRLKLPQSPSHTLKMAGPNLEVFKVRYVPVSSAYAPPPIDSLSQTSYTTPSSTSLYTNKLRSSECTFSSP